MSPELLHTDIRALMVILVCISGSLMVKRVILAYRADYGLHLEHRSRWRVWSYRLRKNPGVNGRSTMDFKVIRREVLTLILFFLFLPGAIMRSVQDRGTSMSWASILITVFLAITVYCWFDLWLHARRELNKHHPKHERPGG